ncbi:MAG: glycosyltransferase family 4 protein [Nocardioidaceae bacterium]|nr:glycosyltransferase family 4 protein [Nocardioidaceae bacterium]
MSALVDGGWHVVVMMPADGRLVPRLRDRGAEVRFVSFPVLRRANQSPLAFAAMLLQALLAVPRMALVTRRMRPDLVYVNTITLPWWILAARVARTPVLCHLHEAETTDRKVVRQALLAPLLLADAVVVISRSVLDAMLAAHPRLHTRARLVYNGVPQPPEPPVPARRGSPFRLAVVARLSPRKAPHLALEATARLREQGRDVVVDLHGSVFDGYEWYLEELKERAARPDLRGAVTFGGYTSPIWSALESSDAVVAPSLREPFGNAVVEAQLALRPVVATAAQGHLESIADGRTGLLVEAEDVDGMTAAIARLMDDPRLAEDLAAQARAEAVDRFSLERYAVELRKVADELDPPAGSR